MSSVTTTDPTPESNATEAAGHTDNEIVIHADPDLVWRMTNDLPTWPELFTEYATVEILSHVGNTFRFRLSMHPDQNGKVWSWVSERTLDPDARRVVARRVEPGPFEFMDIEWSYSAVPDGTRMRWVQDFRMRPEAPVDTPTMTKRINENSKMQMGIIKGKVEAAAAGGAPIVTVIQHAPTIVRSGPTVSRDQTPANRRRGGDIRTLLSPASVGAKAGFLGTLTLEPGEVVTEHWHPYSEEFLYCVTGDIRVTLDGEDRRLPAESAVHIPIGVRHRLVNDGDATAFLVFTCGPLAPRPELGHVDTEPTPRPGSG